MNINDAIRTPNRTEYANVYSPRIFPAQIELISTLQREGIEVWVVSASLEEVVRMIVSNPMYQLNIPPERVLGANLVLKSNDGSTLVSPIERREGKKGHSYFSPKRMKCRLTSIPYAPLTWYSGKLGGILEWIDIQNKPMLVAGDSPNDFYMQLHADVDCGAIRMRITGDERHTIMLEQFLSKVVQGDMYSSPLKGWLEVTPEELGVS